MTPHWKHLNELVLMRSHNLSLYLELRHYLQIIILLGHLYQRWHMIIVFFIKGHKYSSLSGALQMLHIYYHNWGLILQAPLGSLYTKLTSSYHNYNKFLISYNLSKTEAFYAALPFTFTMFNISVQSPVQLSCIFLFFHMHNSIK